MATCKELDDTAPSCNGGRPFLHEWQRRQQQNTCLSQTHFFTSNHWTTNCRRVRPETVGVPWEKVISWKWVPT